MQIKTKEQIVDNIVHAIMLNKNTKQYCYENAAEHGAFDIHFKY